MAWPIAIGGAIAIMELMRVLNDMNRIGDQRRALEDWHKNVPGRKIMYPNIRGPGQVNEAVTNLLTRSMSGIGGLYSNVGRYYRRP